MNHQRKCDWLKWHCGCSRWWSWSVMNDLYPTCSLPKNIKKRHRIIGLIWFGRPSTPIVKYHSGVIFLSSVGTWDEVSWQGNVGGGGWHCAWKIGAWKIAIPPPLCWAGRVSCPSLVRFLANMLYFQRNRNGNDFFQWIWGVLGWSAGQYWPWP